MNRPVISIIVPSIRTQHWRRFLESAANGCTKFPYEVIFIGPFCDKESLEDFPVARHIHSFDRVGVCLQKGCLEAAGKLIFHTVDDGVILPNALDDCIIQYETVCKNTAILNARYREGDGFSNNSFPLSYWKIGSYPTHYGQKYINPRWDLSLQPIVDREFFEYMGGLDCRFEYSNHSHVDFAIRVQQWGGIVHHSYVDVTSADHGQNDHGPIQIAQENIDAPVFNELWNSPRESKINYDNYKQYEGRWERRFSKEYQSYHALCEGESYGS
jgi:hypothetical protein